MRVLRAEHVTTAAAPDQFPREGVPEIAVLGRSNVGKSSLVNRLVSRKRLARTSRTPGKTRLVQFFRVEREHDELLLVDLPGYGFARVSRSERKSWQVLVESYMEWRDPLRGAVLLQDVRRDLSEDETLLLEWLAERAIPAILAITKVDKLKPGRRAERVRALEAAARLPAGRVVATSAEKGLGVQELWKAIDRLL